MVIYKRECLCQKLHAVFKVQGILFGNVGHLDKKGKIQKNLLKVLLLSLRVVTGIELFRRQ